MWQNLRSILKDNKTKCVIIEDGEPRYVVLSFEEYQHLQDQKKGDILEENSANGELSSYARSTRGQDDYGSSINIEDLPF